MENKRKRILSPASIAAKNAREKEQRQSRTTLLLPPTPDQLTATLARIVEDRAFHSSQGLPLSPTPAQHAAAFAQVMAARAREAEEQDLRASSARQPVSANQLPPEMANFTTDQACMRRYFAASRGKLN